MRFEEGSEDRLIGVALLEESDDVLLATRQGKAIRFEGEAVREFQSRTSTGVRGMTLEGGRRGHLALDPAARRHARPGRARRLSPLRPVEGREGRRNPRCPPKRFAELGEREQFILTVCANGYGKLSSAYEYRRTGRGGQGSPISTTSPATEPVVASFTATKADQLMLVTDQAKLIRIGLDWLRVIGRNSAGVKLFHVADERAYRRRGAARRGRGAATRTKAGSRGRSSGQ